MAEPGLQKGIGVTAKRRCAPYIRVVKLNWGIARDDEFTASAPSRRRLFHPVHRTPLGAFALAGASLLFAACGGPSAPGVASVGNGQGSGSAVTTTSVTTGNPSELLDAWASCMRRHGDPSQSDPSIDAHEVIHISISPNVRGGYEGYSGEYGVGGPGTHCVTILQAAQNALRGGKVQKRPSQTKLVDFSQCMRVEGISDFPDPGAQGLVLRVGGDLNPRDPKFQAASEACAKKTGVHGFTGTPQPGTVVLNGAGGLP
jgi:hypothetical protein